MPLTVTILDLPDMHKFENKYADKLLEVLSETDNIELFNSASVRAIVEMKWPETKKAMVKYLLYPYLVLLFGFIYYTLYLFESLAESDQKEDGAEDLGWDVRNPEFWV